MREEAGGFLVDKSGAGGWRRGEVEKWRRGEEEKGRRIQKSEFRSQKAGGGAGFAVWRVLFTAH